MPKITFILPNEEVKEVDAPIGLSLMEIAHKNGINEIEGACGGSLSCATCHVVVKDSDFQKVTNVAPITEEEECMLDLAFDVKPTSRLSCQIKMIDSLDGIELKVPKEC